MNEEKNDDPKEMSAENEAENVNDQSTDSLVVDEAETENESASEEVSEVDQVAQLEAEVEKYKDQPSELRRRCRIFGAEQSEMFRTLINLALNGFYKICYRSLIAWRRPSRPVRRQDKLRMIRS